MTERKMRSALNAVVRAVLIVLVLGCGKKGPSGPPTVTDTTFNVEVRYYGPSPSAQVQAAFEAARGRIQAMITADLPSTNLVNVNLADANTCGVPGVTVNEIVDDLVIYATIKTIDGVGKVQASSGPCLVRSSSKLPALGKMEMDVDDLNQLASTGRLNAVVLHEMLHVLGFGTIWEEVTPVRLAGANTSDSRFTGALAIQGCGDAGGSSICSGGVPVESCVGISGCGEGTRDSHWREQTFGPEIMTGFVSGTGVLMPLSAMSVLSFADLGYTVAVGTADAYKIPGTAIRLPDDENTEVQVPWEITRKARFQVTEAGVLQKR